MQVMFISVTRISSCKVNVKLTLVFVFQGRVIAVWSKRTPKKYWWKPWFRIYGIQIIRDTVFTMTYLSASLNMHISIRLLFLLELPFQGFFFFNSLRTKQYKVRLQWWRAKISKSFKSITVQFIRHFKMPHTYNSSWWFCRWEFNCASLLCKG